MGTQGQNAQKERRTRENLISLKSKKEFHKGRRYLLCQRLRKELDCVPTIKF
jgi:hypothetical protein